MNAGKEVSPPERKQRTQIWLTSTDAHGAVKVLEQLMDASREVLRSRERASRSYHLLTGFPMSPFVSMVAVGFFGILSFITGPFTMGGSVFFSIAALGSLGSLAHSLSKNNSGKQNELKLAMESYRASCKTMLSILDHLKQSNSEVLLKEYILEKCRETPLHIFDTVIENPVELNQQVNGIVKIDGNIVFLNEINIIDHLTSEVNKSVRAVNTNFPKLNELLAENEITDV